MPNPRGFGNVAGFILDWINDQQMKDTADFNTIIRLLAKGDVDGAIAIAVAGSERNMKEFAVGTFARNEDFDKAQAAMGITFTAAADAKAEMEVMNGNGRERKAAS